MWTGKEMLNPFGLNHKNLLKNNNKASGATPLWFILLILNRHLIAENVIEEVVKEKLLAFLFSSFFISKGFMKTIFCSTIKNLQKYFLVSFPFQHDQGFT